MRRLFTLLAALLLLASPALADGAAFSYDDLRVGALTPGATREQAEKAFGAPAATEMIALGDTGTIVDCLRYEGLSLYFKADALYRAEWTRDGISGARDLAVGLALERVTDAFYRDYAQKESYVLYESGRLESGLCLPPLGVVGAEGDALTICYQAPVEPYPASVEGDPASYVKYPHATLCFEANVSAGRVNRIWWAVDVLE